MAPRKVHLRKNRGDAPIPGAVKQKKNRCVLDEIGNTIAVRGLNVKPLPQVSRPVTRGFFALLRARVLAAKNNKNLVAINGNAAIVADGALPEKRAPLARKPPQKKKNVAKPKPVEIIEISPDTEEVHEPTHVNDEKLGENSVVELSSRKQAGTLTSILTARIQAACGLSGEQNEDIVDIDVAKPKPVEIIEISPDTEEVHIKEKPPHVNDEKLGENSVDELSSRKQARTLTSILIARIQAVFGLSGEQKEDIVDIDAADVNNELAVVEYVDGMYSYYKSAENESAANDYMDSQPEINEKMRAILIDWLIHVHYKFKLSPETLFLIINIMDRYLSVAATSRSELQLVGISAMLIASKYEEIWPPDVNKLVRISANTYSSHQVLVMEKRILEKLEWNITVPTLYVFLLRFIKASMTDSDVENMVYFLAELGMMNYATIMYCPSMIAASAVYAARCTLNKTPRWNETLKKHTGFLESQLMDCAKLLVSFHSAAAENEFKGIYMKYTSMKLSPTPDTTPLPEDDELIPVSLTF